MKMIGKKLKSFQVDDDDVCASSGSIKRREEIQWRTDFNDELLEAQYDPEEWNDCS